jgi:hypothetical protein
MVGHASLATSYIRCVVLVGPFLLVRWKRGERSYCIHIVRKHDNDAMFGVADREEGLA